MRLALCAQPSTNQQVSLSFDHTGGLTGRCGSAMQQNTCEGTPLKPQSMFMPARVLSALCSVKTTRDSISARLFGTLDSVSYTHLTLPTILLV